MLTPVSVLPPRPLWPVTSSLRLPDLLHITGRVADDVLSGRYGSLLPAGGLPTDRRWFTRIHGDGDLDVWLISWVPGQPTELHDHGESLGVLTVLSGALDEFSWNGRRLRRRRLDAGDQAGFRRGWVHDVVWAPPKVPKVAKAPKIPKAGAAPLESVPPTLSVHAYSPPLTEMSYYRVAGDALRHQRTELTDQPESD